MIYLDMQYTSRSDYINVLYALIEIALQLMRYRKLQLILIHIQKENIITQNKM